MAAKKQTALMELRGTLTTLGPEFKAALPAQIPADKFVRVALTALNKNPDLVNADRNSLLGAFMTAAQDGLLPDGREAVIALFGNKATYMPMVAGILKKVRNSGELKQIVPEIVHENDRFEYWIDENGQHLSHHPLMDGDRGKVTHVYAVANAKDGGVYIEVMTTKQVEEVRAISKAKGASPWKTWWNEMARKTVIRRLSKRLPVSTDLDDLIRRDDDLYDVGKDPAADKTETAATDRKTPSRLKKVIEGETVEKKKEDEPKSVEKPEPTQEPPKKQVRHAMIGEQREEEEDEANSKLSDASPI